MKTNATDSNDSMTNRAAVIGATRGSAVGAVTGGAAVGELFGDGARAAILVALLDGRARTAGELALAGNISAQSASGHLAKVTAGGLWAVRSQGRHRYYELANADVAHALEASGSLTMRRANGDGGAALLPNARFAN